MNSLAQVTNGNDRYGCVKFGKQFNSSIEVFVSADLHKVVCHSSSTSSVSGGQSK